MRRAVAGIACLAALPLSACAGGEPAQASAVGTALYDDPLPGVVPARSVVLQPLEEGSGAELPPARHLLTVGAADGDEDGLFQDVSDIEVGADGAFWVLDRGSRRIRHFAPSGGLLRAWGGQGHGPGEFEDPGELELLPWSGEVAVWDGALRRATFAAASGQVRRTVSLFAGGEPTGSSAPALRSVRGFRAVRDGFVVEMRDDPLRTPTGQRAHLVRLDTALANPDTLYSVAVGQSSARVLEVPGARGMGGTAPPLLSPEPRWDLLADGTPVLAPGGRYVLYFLDGDGGAALRISRPGEPPPLTRADRLRCWEEVRERADHAGQPMLPAEELDRRNPRRFAPVRPAITGLLSDGERAWVRRFGTAGHACARAPAWHVYDRSGQPLGGVEFPRGFQPLALHGGRAYGVRTDSLGVQFVEVYQLPEPGVESR